MTNHEHSTQYDIASIMGGIYGDGIVAQKGAFERAWVEHLREDIEVLFQEALQQPGSVLDRGPNRYYVEIHPERLRGFTDLASHPWVTTVCKAILGPDYRIVEVGFDIPGPGAQNQPWHRDFPAPEATLHGRRLTSLAFNVTTVDVTEKMGPFEIAVGTQWDDPEEFTGGMFPPKSHYAHYQQLAQRKLPQMGDISARTALTIHRGTANHSAKARPVLVLGVDAPDDHNADKHDIQITRAFHDSLPDSVRQHLVCRVVDKLEPIVQAHKIEGLLMADSP